MSGNVWNRPSGSLMVDMGISINIIKSPSPKCYMTFITIKVPSSIDQTLQQFVNLLPNLTLLPILTLSPKLRVSIEHCNGCVFSTEDAFSSGHLVLSLLGPAFVLMLRPFSPDLVMFSNFEFRTSISTSILLTEKLKNLLNFFLH